MRFWIPVRMLRLLEEIHKSSPGGLEKWMRTAFILGRILDIVLAKCVEQGSPTLLLPGIFQHDT